MEPVQARSPLRGISSRTAQLRPEVGSGRDRPGRPGPARRAKVRHANRRSHNSAQQGFTENKGPKPIAKSNPCRRRAILASISNHARPLGTPPDSPPVHCLVNTVGRRRQRRARRLFEKRILSCTHAAVFMPLGAPHGHADFDIALPPSFFDFCSPISPSAPRTSRNRLCPTATGRFYVVVICLLLDGTGKNGFVRSNLGAASNAHRCTILHNSAQSCTTGARP